MTFRVRESRPAAGVRPGCRRVTVTGFEAQAVRALWRLAVGLRVHARAGTHSDKLRTRDHTGFKFLSVMTRA